MLGVEALETSLSCGSHRRGSITGGSSGSQSSNELVGEEGLVSISGVKGAASGMRVICRS